ncbi:MAG: Nif11-like leader peptide family RiPP precursor [Chamaesiphon sp.]|nr:Nif11-like leader peptide family RiPP precursor [Chamaesiphon sp.]
MSHKTVADFFQDIKTDSELKELVKNAGSTSANDSQPTTRIAPEDILRIACDKGYEFNVEELQAYVQKSRQNGELSMEELESVAGGRMIIIIIF